MDNNEIISKEVQKTEITGVSQPVIDMEAINSALPEQREQIIKDYSQKLCEYQESLNKENNAGLEQKYNEALKYIECVKAKEELSAMPEFPDFSKMLPQIENLTKAIPGCADMSPVELYTISYLVAKGIESTNQSANPKTTEQKLAEICRDEKLMRALEEKRISELSSRSELPKMSADGGLASSAVNLAKKPMTIEQAYRQSIEELS